MTKKATILYLYQILKSKTDINNPMTSRMLIATLKEKHGIVATRQTIYDHIKILNACGIEILSAGICDGFYYSNRLFEESEAALICHSLLANKTIPNRLSNDLINKVLSTQSEHYRNNFNYKTSLNALEKEENKQLFYNIQTISEAIQESYKIQFRYTKYNLNKRIVYKNNKVYEVIPYYIICQEGKLYLICHDEYHDNDISYYRIDRIVEITKLEEKQDTKSFDPYEFSKKRLYMYSGDLISVKMKCKHRILDDVLERFSSDTKISKIDEEYFMANVETTVQAAVFFAFQFIDFVEILSPNEVVLEIKKMLDNATDKYKGGNGHGI